MKRYLVLLAFIALPGCAQLKTAAAWLDQHVAIDCNVGTVHMGCQIGPKPSLAEPAKPDNP